ncbi:coiled-coil domain-containing protein 13-like [Branchiostoma lanceolatum]|uniref:coiled-coil domain-containing protein 13-like n=1 Tax=Branchiostoma lanceolatum TaxID=7740 RepID=UPI0034562543
MESTSETLKQQFASLQEQQKKKMQRLKERKQQLKKEQEKGDDEKPIRASMYVEDDMGLELSGPPQKNDIMYAEEQMTNLKDQVRELRDENGRLYKLLSERDYEVRQIRKKMEKERALLTGGTGGVASEAAATKIVDLSKRNRELTAEVESGRTKMTQLTRKVQDLEKQLKAAAAQARASARDEKASPRQISLSLEEEKDSEADVKALKDKLTQTTSKLLETKNEVSMLKQELKVANRVLEKEVGEGVNIQALLKDSSGFRGRSQQILNLQKKVSELKSQLGMQTTRSGSGLSLEEQFMGTSTRTTNYSDKNRDRIRQLERDRKEATEKAQAEKEALEADYSKMKDRFDAGKARNKVLANEVKSLKDQLAVLLDKGKNDDELITALMNQQEQMQKLLEQTTKKQQEYQQQQQAEVTQIITKNMQDQNIVDQLKAIVAQKEGQVKALEEEIKEIRDHRMQAMQGGHVSPVRRPPSRSTPSDLHGNRPPSAHHGLGSSMSSSPHGNSSHGNIMRPTSSEAFYLNSQNQNGRGSRTGSAQGQAAVKGATIIRPSTDSELKVKDIEVQLQEQRTVCQAAQVERDKLLELVQVLHNRLDEAEQKATEADSQLTQHRQRNVQLEKQLGKAKLENKGTPKKGRTVRDSVGQGDIKPNPDDIEEMEVQLSIQQDENEALKEALQSTLKEKEEDLKFYRTVMDQTKQIFLQGLREHRQRGATS